MEALIPDERCVILAWQVFFLQIRTYQAVSETSAATYKVMKPHSQVTRKSPFWFDCLIVCRSVRFEPNRVRSSNKLSQSFAVPREFQDEPTRH